MSDSCNAFLGIATPFYGLGESHVLPFRNVLFAPSPSSPIFVGRVRFFQVMAAQFSVNVTLHEKVLTALQSEQLISESGAATHLVKDHQSNRIADVSGIIPDSPRILLFAGDLDVSDILRKLGANYDFELPDDPGYGRNRALELVPFSALTQQLDRIFDPFLNAARLLKELGFDRLMIHGLPPRIRDTKKQAWTGVTAECQVRAKITILANRKLAAISHMLDVPFLDIWPQITEDGYLRDEFSLDGFHLKRSAAVLSLKQALGG